MIPPGWTPPTLPDHLQRIVDECKAEGRTANPEEQEALIDHLLLLGTEAEMSLE